MTLHVNIIRRLRVYISGRQLICLTGVFPIIVIIMAQTKILEKIKANEINGALDMPLGISW